jgi:nucleoside-diphosphate-sugar epimerase
VSGPTLVVGATGFVGGHLADALRAGGHEVLGLARSSTAEQTLAARGLGVLPGDLARPVELRGRIGEADVATIVYAAATDVDTEAEVVAHLLDAAPTFVFLSGTGVLMQRSGGAHSGLTFAEDDAFEPEPLALRRVETEHVVRRAAGTRGLVLRPPEIWGPGARGRIASILASVERTGQACYVGEGTSAYGHVGADGLGDLLRRALDRAPAGALYHAVDGEAANRDLAAAVGRELGVPTRSVDPAEAVELWGEFGALIMAATSSTTSPRAEAELGWRPSPVDLEAEVRAAVLSRAATSRSGTSRSARPRHRAG